MTQKIENDYTALAVEAFAINTAINLISGCIAKCEFKTFLDGKEVKDEDYYSWNYEPNKNQNSTEFISKLVSKLLFENECLVIENAGQYLIADSFYRHEYAVMEDYFDNVTIKDFTFDKTFRMSDVFYFKLNDKNITKLLDGLMQGYNNLMNMAVGKYKRSGGRKGIIHLDAIRSGDQEAKKRRQKLFDEDFKAYFTAENAVLPLNKGEDYTEQNGEGSKKSTSEMKDIRDLLDEEFIRVAQAYKIPPAILKGDIANVSEITDNLLTFCIDPIVDLIQTEINRKSYGKNVLKGSRLVIDTTCILHIDVFAIADKIDKLISDGIYSIDEIRAKIKDSLINEEWSKKHFLTKNFEDITQIDNMKGGEMV
nr:phage portal protein [Clostridium cadaveris]